MCGCFHLCRHSVLAEGGPTESRVRERPAQLDHLPPQPPEAAAPRTDPGKRHSPAAHPPNSRHHQPTPEPPPYPDHLRHVGVTAAPDEPPLPPKRAAVLPHRLSPPRLDTPGGVGDTASSLREPSERHGGPLQGGHPVRGRSPGIGLALPTVPTLGPDTPLRVSPCPDREPQAGSRLEEEWRALHQTALAALEPSRPHPPSLSPSALKGAALIVPTNATRSPSPQCAPPRLTDKPPAPPQSV